MPGRSLLVLALALVAALSAPPPPASAQAAAQLELLRPLGALDGAAEARVAARVEARLDWLAACPRVAEGPLTLGLSVSSRGDVRAVAGSFALSCATAAFAGLRFGELRDAHFLQLHLVPAADTIAFAAPDDAGLDAWPVDGEAGAWSSDDEPHVAPLTAVPTPEVAAGQTEDPAPRRFDINRFVAILGSVTLAGIGIASIGWAVEDPGWSEVLLVTGGVIAAPGLVVFGVAAGFQALANQ